MLTSVLSFLNKTLFQTWSVLLSKVIVVIGLLFVFWGGYEFYDYSNTSQVQSLVTTTCGVESSHTVFVDVSGAVVAPGLYELESNSRFSQAIEAAGGFSVLADAEFVSKQTNMAQFVTDGEKIYIPQKGEHNKSNETLQLGQAFVSLNQATIEELMSLSGIGEKRAEDIVENRPYHSIEDLENIGVISSSLFNQIKPQLTL